MTYSLDWIFLDQRGIPPVASIFIKTSTRNKYDGYEELTFITPECVTQGEFDYEIKRLHAELEEIQKAIHKKFATFQSRDSD